MLKVLLVDDEPFILQGLQVLIDWEQEGYEIPRTASNGQEALEMLEDEAADLIIADINSNSTKARKARELNVNIISPSDLSNIISHRL